MCLIRNGHDGVHQSGISYMGAVYGCQNSIMLSLTIRSVLPPY